MANPNGNPQNLDPVKSKKEAIKRGRNGGKKSGEVRRQRKQAKECMNLILKLDAKGKKSKELMSNLGIEDKEQQNIMLLMSTLFMKAATTGEPNAVKAVLEIAGEWEERQGDTKPEININISAATKEDVTEEQGVIVIDIDVKVNPAYLPYMNKTQFNQIFFGGASSGKSYFLGQKIAIDNLNGCNYLC